MNAERVLGLCHIIGAVILLYASTITDANMATLTDDEKNDFKPDLLVTIGDSLVSGRVKKYLRQHKPVEHWRIHRTEELVDTYDSLTHCIVTKPTLLLHHLVGKDVQAESVYASRAAEKETTNRYRHEKLLPTLPFCDLTAFYELLKSLPDGTNLHLANSTPIRYSQLYATNPQISYHCNRGTSGIDGCLSTATGAAYAGKQPTTLITGDLAFIYDSNGMWNRQFPGNLKVIVMNNGGGNIFRMIESGETMTETSSHVALRPVNGPKQSLLYEILPGVEVSNDSRGCLTITAPTLTNQTLVTNDVVRIADSRHFEWIGRADNVINSGGVKIFPEQVEKKLFPHIHRRYFVAGQPDDALGERVVLFIEGEPLQADEQQRLQNLFPTILQRYETPRQLVAIPHFRLSDAGKVQKRATLEQYQRGKLEK